MRQIPLAIGIEAPRTFGTFVPGANALAIAHLEALGAQAAPVYLWGGSGAGKTHLPEALVHRLDTFSLATKRAITVPLLKQMLVEEGAR